MNDNLKVLRMSQLVWGQLHLVGLNYIWKNGVMQLLDLFLLPLFDLAVYIIIYIIWSNHGIPTRFYLWVEEMGQNLNVFKVRISSDCKLFAHQIVSFSLTRFLTSDFSHQISLIRLCSFRHFMRDLLPLSQDLIWHFSSRNLVTFLPQSKIWSDNFFASIWQHFYFIGW